MMCLFISVATAEDSKVRFLKEAAIMSQFNHPNIGNMEWPDNILLGTGVQV